MRQRNVRLINTGSLGIERDLVCRVEECSLQGLPELHDFPLCGHHAAEAMRVLIRSVHGTRREALLQLIAPDTDRPAGVVYYVDFGDWIKIGTTVRLDARMMSFRNSHPDPILLATEVGGRGMEHRRHTQFREYSVGREMFSKGDRLMAHIAKLASEVA